MKNIPVPVMGAVVAVLVLLALIIGWRTLNSSSTAPTHLGADGKKIEAATPPGPQKPDAKGTASGASPADAQ